jgi:hypothetical protein
MALSESTQEALCEALARSAQGCLTEEVDNLTGKQIVLEILANQLAILRVLAEMNGLGCDAKCRE